MERLTNLRNWAGILGDLSPSSSQTKETAICEVDQIGKTLFLTRDAAEKALKGVKA